MQSGQPSLTARRRGAPGAAPDPGGWPHLRRIPLAAPLLGEPPEAMFRSDPSAPAVRGMRLFIAARSRFAEDALGAAVARGRAAVRGARRRPRHLRPAQPARREGARSLRGRPPGDQAWKRDRIAGAGLGAPPGLTFAPVDFERQTLADGLGRAGFDASRPAFFSWLGVVPYLSREGVFATLAFVASVPGGEVALDYAIHRPRSLRTSAWPRTPRRPRGVAGRALADLFHPPDLARDFGALGFSEIEDLGPAEMSARYFGGPRREGPAAMSCGRRADGETASQGARA